MQKSILCQNFVKSPSFLAHTGALQVRLLLLFFNNFWHTYGQENKIA